MDFQVHKNKVLQKLGQTSVEYILLIVVISTAVLGLLSFSDTIKGKIENQKMNLALKLGGSGAEISRSDFSFKNVVVKDVGGEGEGGGAGAGGKGGAGKGRGGNKGGVGGQGNEAGTGSKGGLGRGQGAGGGEGGEDENADEEDVKNRTKVSNQEAGGSVTYSQEQKRRAKAGAGYKEGEGSGEGEEGGVDLLNTKSPEELKAIKEKQEEAKKWNIFKFLIIIAIIFFFIVIVLKARNSRD